MKIVIAGGGSGGHFYPLIAIVQEIRTVVREEKLLEPTIYYVSPDPYNKRMLFDMNITYHYVMGGKIRYYFSLKNIVDGFKTFVGMMQALWHMFWIYPDVVIGKGGYASFPALWAAKILRIPVVIHESDSEPGRVNKWAAKFARKIAISYPEASKHFPASIQDKIAWTGNPIRKEITYPSHEGAFEYLDLDPQIPVILILGGSQGSQRLNDAILDALPRLLDSYQVIHQTGKKNISEVQGTAEVVVPDTMKRKRYRPIDYLNDLTLRMSAGAASLIISRAGSQIFEIASWGVPSIIVPIPETISHDQVRNAFNYARSGAATVIEENNLSDDILVAEVNKIMNNPEGRKKMMAAAQAFSKHDAGKTIARAVLAIALKHED